MDAYGLGVRCKLVEKKKTPSKIGNKISWNFEAEKKTLLDRKCELFTMQWHTVGIKYTSIESSLSAKKKKKSITDIRFILTH